MDTNQFALRLNRLFKEKKKPDGKSYSQTEVLESLNGVLTRVYLWRLRKGMAANPSFQVICGLADFFAVDPGYFFVKEDSEAASSPSWNSPTREIAQRIQTLTPEEQLMVLYMIEAIQKSHRSKAE